MNSPRKFYNKLILMAGTIFFALIPLYLTAWRDMVYDGGLLIVSIAFLSDAIFRCLDPYSKRHALPLNQFLAVGSMAILALSLLQYAPIATDLRHEKRILDESRHTQSITLIDQFESAREQREQELPNSSAVLLSLSILLEFSVIVYQER